MKDSEFLIEGEVYEQGDKPDVLEVTHNYSFGCFSLNLFIESWEPDEYVGIRLTRDKAIAIRDEIDRLLKLDDQRTLLASSPATPEGGER